MFNLMKFFKKDKRPEFDLEDWFEKSSGLETEYPWVKEWFKLAKEKPFKVIDMIDELPWHATKRYQQRNVEKDVTGVVVHVTDTFAKIENINAYDIGPDNSICTKKPKGCPHFTYHYWIRYPYGQIIQANSLASVAYHCKGKNSSSVGISFQGKFACMKAGDYKKAFTHTNLGKRDIRKGYVEPTVDQIVSLIQLLDVLYFRLPNYEFRKRLYGHCDIDRVNRVCDPGDTIYFMLQLYKKVRSKYGF